jgi:hypothetical protein
MDIVDAIPTYFRLHREFDRTGTFNLGIDRTLGDQIYADELNRMLPIGRADTETEFQERYSTAFSSPNMRRLLRSVPNYMILDDHEIEDNWTQTSTAFYWPFPFADGDPANYVHDSSAPGQEDTFYFSGDVTMDCKA